MSLWTMEIPKSLALMVINGRFLKSWGLILISSLIGSIPQFMYILALSRWKYISLSDQISKQILYKEKLFLSCMFLLIFNNNFDVDCYFTLLILLFRAQIRYFIFFDHLFLDFRHWISISEITIIITTLNLHRNQF